jgi:hypothetical protein
VCAEERLVWAYEDLPIRQTLFIELQHIAGYRRK